MARAFAANVSVAQSGISLFFVVGRHTSPRAAVLAAGGRIAVDFGDQRRLIAVLPIMAGNALPRDPRVALAGPVNLDPTRFARFAARAGFSITDGGAPSR